MFELLEKEGEEEIVMDVLRDGSEVENGDLRAWPSCDFMEEGQLHERDWRAEVIIPFGGCFWEC